MNTYTLDDGTKVRAGKVHTGIVRNTFEVISPRRLTERELYNLQVSLGYHPCGYSGPWVSAVKQDGPNEYYTTFTCADSCD
jgi:hypothetical protein